MALVALLEKRGGRLLAPLLLALVLFTLFFTGGRSFDFLTPAYLDMRAHHLAHCWNDPTLYARGVQGEYCRGAVRLTPQAAHFFFLAGFLRFLPPLTAVALFGGVMFLLSLRFLFKCAESLGEGRAFAWVCTVLFAAHMTTMDTFQGGQPRALGMAAFCALLWAASRGSLLALPAFLPLLALVYPHVLPTAGVFCVLCAVRVPAGERRRYALIGVGALVAAAVLLFLQMDPVANAALLTYVDNPRHFKFFTYAPDGVRPVDLRAPSQVFLNFVLNLNEHPRSCAFSTAVLLAACASLLRRGARPAAAPLLLLSSGAVAFAALFPFAPVLASRQFIFVLAPALALCAGLGLWRLSRPAAVAALPAALLAAFAAHARWTNLVSLRPYRPLFEYVRALPKEAVVAGYGHSPALEVLPLATRRTEYEDLKTDHGIPQRYLGEVLRRNRALYEAMYTDDPGVLRGFLEREPVDWLFVEDYIYTEEFARENPRWEKNLVYAPFAEEGNLHPSRERARSVLLAAARRCAELRLDFGSHDGYLVSARALRAALAASGR